MVYAQELTDILDDLISTMTFPVIIGNVTVNADDSITLECDNIYHAQAGFEVEINSLTYVITEIDQANESITVTGTGTISNGDTFDMYSPFFFHGTPIATNTELVQEAQALNKTPMFWLWENFEEDWKDEESSLEREVEIELFALTQANFEEWMTSDAYENAIKPMKRLIELFVQALKVSSLFETDFLTYRTENYSKFGVFIRNKGASKNLFADKLSGVGTKINLRIFKTEPCEPSFEVEQSIYRTLSTGDNRTLTTGDARTTS